MGDATSEEITTSTPPISETELKKTNTLSRREFLRLLGELAIMPIMKKTTDDMLEPSVAESAEFLKTYPATPNRPPSVDNQKNSYANEKDISDEQLKHPYIRTAVEQCSWAVAKKLVNGVLGKYNIPYGNKTFTEAQYINYMKNNPIPLLIEQGLFGPVVEEAGYRAIPVKLTGGGWNVGIPLQTVFAFLHNVKTEWPPKLAKSVPLSQFMGGLFSWYLMRERGYNHAIFAHSLNNTAEFSIGVLLFKIFPPDKAERIARQLTILRKTPRVD